MTNGLEVGLSDCLLVVIISEHGDGDGDGAETHLGGGVFVLPLNAIRRVPSFDVCWQYSSQERPTKILTTLP